MATSAEDGPQPLVDTSVAVAPFSVLTRLPAAARRTPATVARLLAANFPRTRFLGEEAADALLADLQSKGIAGPSVHDALVGAAAAQHGLPLATRDRRAVATCRTPDVDVELLGGGE